MYLHDCDPRLVYDFLKKRKPRPIYRVWYKCKMARYPGFGCLYDLVSNPRLGCFGEIDSRGYGTHLNGTDPPPPPRDKHKWPSPIIGVLDEFRAGGGGGSWSILPEYFFPIACTKIKWFCPNITWFCFWPGNGYLKNSRGSAAPPPPPLAPWAVRIWALWTESTVSDILIESRETYRLYYHDSLCYPYLWTFHVHCEYSCSIIMRTRKFDNGSFIHSN